MIPWYFFPPTGATCVAKHDTSGWTLTAHPATHPANGAPCQAFDMPADTPDQNGCGLTMTDAKGRLLYSLHGVLYLHLPTGAGLVVDVYPTPPASSALTKLVAVGQVLAQDVQ